MSVLKVGIVLPLFSSNAGRVLAVAREAEALGFDGVFAFDHLLPLGGAADGPALECFTTLAAVGAVTSRVAIGSLVARIGLRPVGMLAKLAATIDQISGGRAILAMGTGDHLSDREHRAFGFPAPPMDERRALLAETALAVKALFRGDPYAGGPFVPALDGPLLPPPFRPGGPPVWVGGASPAVVRLAARVADAWNGWGLDAERFVEMVRILDDSATAAVGRRVEPTWSGLVLVGEDESETNRLAGERAARGMPVPTVTAPTDRLAEHLRGLAEAGATWAVLLVAGPPDRVRLIGERVLPELA